jgi:carbamate kinase
MVEDAGRGYRKVVPSPKPIDVVTKWVIRDLVCAGRIVIAAGGGGIPIVINGRGLFTGVEAVIDKDYVAGLIAREVKVDLFIILTGIERVFLDYGTPQERPIESMTVAQAQEYLDQGQFPRGSMGPKIEAAVEYIRAGGKEVLITSASHLKAALLNRSGTRITAA